MQKRATAGEKRAFRNERGSAAVEFALLTPLLLMLISGIIEFSVAFNREQGLQAAAHQGARVASFAGSDTADITSAVTGALTGVPIDAQVNITVAPHAAVPCEDASSVVVTVSTTSPLRVAFFDITSLTQSGSAEFVCEK